MVLQASARHELIYEKALLVLEAVPEEAHEIGVVQLTQVVDLGLQGRKRGMSTEKMMDEQKGKGMETD